MTRSECDGLGIDVFADNQRDEIGLAPRRSILVFAILVVAPALWAIVSISWFILCINDERADSELVLVLGTSSFFSVWFCVLVIYPSAPFILRRAILRNRSEMVVSVVLMGRRHRIDIKKISKVKLQLLFHRISWRGWVVISFGERNIEMPLHGIGGWWASGVHSKDFVEGIETILSDIFCLPVELEIDRGLLEIFGGHD